MRHSWKPLRNFFGEYDYYVCLYCRDLLHKSWAGLSGEMFHEWWDSYTGICEGLNHDKATDSERESPEMDGEV